MVGRGVELEQEHDGFSRRADHVLLENQGRDESDEQGGNENFSIPLQRFPLHFLRVSIRSYSLFGSASIYIFPASLKSYDHDDAAACFPLCTLFIKHHAVNWPSFSHII
jgi:hypothetical protein